jgi:rhamnogalacturonan endolyase
MAGGSTASWLAISAVAALAAVASAAGALSCGDTPVISLGDGPCAVPSGPAVTLQQAGTTFTLSNGLLTMTIAGNGQVTALSKNGTALMASGQTMYLSDSESAAPGREINATTQTVVSQSPQQVELSFVDTSGAMNWDLHYVMQAGLSGFYYYLIADTLGKPPLLMPELRTVHSFDATILSNGFNAERRGQLPTPSMQATFLGSNQVQDDAWELPDAATLPGVPGPEGPVYTPYDWATYVAEDWTSGHGLYGGGFGVWLLTGSPEYVTGGPMKQEFMVQAGSLFNYYNGGHFGSNVVTPSPANWRKVYGPSLLYVNTGTDLEVISDAASQSAVERAAWPYCWMNQAAYPTQAQRAVVDGTISVTQGRSAAGAMVVLADPSELYLQSYGYMYWTHADASGNFTISGVRPGTYAVHVYATQGDITASVDPTLPTNTGSAPDGGSDAGPDGGLDASGGSVSPADDSEVIATNITVTSGMNHLGTLVWSPAYHPNLLWEIGTSDRSSGEFLVSGTTVASHALREYGPSATEGLWGIPPANLTYTVGTSSPAQDWYFAQSKTGTWNVVFGLDRAVTGNAYLTLSIASVSQNPRLSVSVNGTSIFNQTFGNDGTLYRSALTSGRYQLLTVVFPASYLTVGAASNTMAFNLDSPGPATGIMYDLVKLETD